MDNTSDTTPDPSVNSSTPASPSTPTISSTPAGPSTLVSPSTPAISSTPASPSTLVSFSTSAISSSPASPASTSTSNKIILVDTPELMTKAFKEIDRQNKIALICEGLEVSRKGAVDIVCVGLRGGKIFLFDIAERGAWLESGLRDLLECDSDPVLGTVDKVKDKVDKMKRMYERRRSLGSDSIPEIKLGKIKLMFDCRNVSDALLHRHNVRLDGVLDLQLLEIVHRRKYFLNHELLRGVEECLETYANDLHNKFAKHRGMDEFERVRRTGLNPWTVRPLSSELIDSFAADVSSLFSLYDVLKRHKSIEDMTLVLQSSKRYANYFRSYKTFPKEEFYRNAFVPHNILIWIPREAHDPPRRCDACQKEFGMSELSSSVIFGSPLCALCIKIVRKIKDETGEFPQIYVEPHIEHNSKGTKITVSARKAYRPKRSSSST